MLFADFRGTKQTRQLPAVPFCAKRRSSIQLEGKSGKIIETQKEELLQAGKAELTRFRNSRRLQTTMKIALLLRARLADLL